MKNLQEFEVKDMSNVVGGEIRATHKISGILDGIKGNTVIQLDYVIS